MGQGYIPSRQDRGDKGHLEFLLCLNGRVILCLRLKALLKIVPTRKCFEKALVSLPRCVVFPEREIRSATLCRADERLSV